MTNTEVAPAAPFPSLESLWAAHRKLNAANRGSDSDLADVDAVMDFLRRGEATGALLDGERDRQAAQSLLTYWTTRLYRIGAEPPEYLLADFDPSLAPELPDSACPYLGLDAFREGSRQYFFGRQQLSETLIEHLHKQKLLAVVGASGSGKSSLVRAGLIPALRAGRVPGSENWVYYPPTLPGANPLLALARVLKPAGVDEKWDERTAEAALRDPGHFVSVIAAQTKSWAVIVIDQFEEIFTLCQDDAVRRAFSAGLLRLLDAGHVIIVTMRTDFEARIALLPELQPRFEAAVVSVTPLSAAELREAILAPASLVGLKFEEGVVNALVEDILGEPAGLPLLQFTLLKLWEHRDHNRVTWEAYKRLGGGRKALAKAADEFFDRLIQEDQDTAKRILLKLVRPGQGLEVTSNRMLVSDLYRKSEASDRVERVLERLIQARLVRRTEGHSEAETQVEVAHEALVRNWPRLVTWLEDEREALRLRQRLTTAAEQWLRLGKDPGALRRGRVLEESLRYDDLTELEHEYVQASLAAEEAEREAKRRAEEQALKAQMAEQVAELERQRAAEQTQRAEEQARLAKELRFRLNVSRALVALAALLLLAAVYFGWQAQLQRDAAQVNAEAARAAQATAQANAVAAEAAQARAESASAEAAFNAGQAEQRAHEAEAARQEAQAQRELGFAQRLAAESRSQINTAPDLALLLGVASARITTTVESQRSLLEALASPQPIPLALGADPPAHSGRIYSVAYNSDGSLLASGDEQGNLWIWDTSARAALGDRLRFEGGISYLAFSPTLTDTLFVASCWSAADDGCARSVIEQWNILTRERVGQPITLTAPIASFAISPDGRRLAWPICAAAGDGCIANVVQIWNVRAQWLERELRGHRNFVGRLAFNRTGQWLASPSCSRLGADDICLEGEVRVWDVASGQLIQRLLVPQRQAGVGIQAYATAFSPVTDALAAGYQDGSIYFWPNVRRADQWQTLAGLSGHRNWVNSLSFSVDGQVLASSSDDQTVQLWSLSANEPRPLFVQPLRKHTSLVWSVAYSPNNQTFASAGSDSQIILWSLAGSRLDRQTLPGHDGLINGLAVAAGPQGALIASGAADGLRLWSEGVRFASTEARTALVPVSNSIQGRSLAFSPNGRLIAVGNADGTLGLWSASSRRLIGKLINAHAGPIWGLAFSPDGSLIATVSERDSALRLWETATRQLRAEVIRPTAGAWGLAFSPDGRTIAVGESTGTISLWDAASGVQRAALQGHTGWVISLAFSPDGRRLASGGEDGTVRLWNPATGQEVGRLSGHTDWIGSVVFSPDGRQLASSSGDGTIRVWTVATQQLRGQLRAAGGSVLRTLAFSPNGLWLAAGSYDAKVYVWNVAGLLPLDPELTGHTDGVFAIAFSPDGRLLVSTGIDSTVRLWDVETRLAAGQLEPVETTAPQRVTALAVSPDGRRLVTGGEEGVLALWDSTQVAEPVILDQYTAAVSQLFLGTKGELVALFADNTVHGWNITDSPAFSITLPFTATESATVSSLALAPLASGDVLAVGFSNGTLGLARVESWLTPNRSKANPTFLRKWSGHNTPVRQLAFSSDGSTLISGDDSGEIIAWNLASAQTQSLPAMRHNGAVTALAVSVSANTRILASAAGEELFLWDLSTSRIVGQLSPGYQVNRLAFLPDGQSLVVGGESGGLTVFRIGPAALQTQACAIAGRNLSWFEWQNYLAGYVGDYQVVCDSNPVAYGDLALGWFAEAQADTRLNPDQVGADMKQAVENALRVEALEPARTLCLQATGLLRELAQPACAHAARFAGNGLERIELFLGTGDTAAAIREVQALTAADWASFVEDSLIATCYNWLDTPALAETAPDTWCAQALARLRKFQDAQALNDFCWNVSARGAPRLGVAACDEALRISPDYTNALDSRAIAHALLAQQTGSRDYSAAIADLKRAIELAPGSNLELYLEERRQFLEQLERGEFPFTPELIQRFKDDGY